MHKFAELLSLCSLKSLRYVCVYVCISWKHLASIKLEVAQVCVYLHCVYTHSSETYGFTKYQNVHILILTYTQVSRHTGPQGTRYTHIHINTYIQTYIYNAYPHSYIHMNVKTYSSTRYSIHGYTHKYTHTHIHTYIYSA